MPDFRIERLAKQDRSGFDCGASALNDYLQRRARQDQRRRVAACYLLVEEASESIFGYYTLSAGSVMLGDLSEAVAKKLPRYPIIPVARIGRPAIEQTQQGCGLGGVLLADAVQRAAASDIAAFAVIVDAKNDRAVAFYVHNGFTTFESQPRVLFLPISEALKSLADN